MLKHYVLAQKIINGRYVVNGIEYIHDAILTSEGDKSFLIMDTTPAEDEALSDLALEVREVSEKERNQFNSMYRPPNETVRDVFAELDDLKARITKLAEKK